MRRRYFLVCGYLSLGCGILALKACCREGIIRGIEDILPSLTRG